VSVYDREGRIKDGRKELMAEFAKNWDGRKCRETVR
jgi:hypothetical protein